MENLILSLNVVLPLFITMSLGYFLKSLNMFDNNTLDTMNNITFKSFLPMLLFSPHAQTAVHSAYINRIRYSTQTLYRHPSEPLDIMFQLR